MQPLALQLARLKQGVSHMLYKNADKVFPKHLVEELQTYFDGGYIYIPSKKKNIAAGENAPAIVRKSMNAISA